MYRFIPIKKKEKDLNGSVWFGILCVCVCMLNKTGSSIARHTNLEKSENKNKTKLFGPKIIDCHIYYSSLNYV